MFCVCIHQQIIVSYPPTKQLTSEEQDLVWKFRYYLTTQEKVGVSVVSLLLYPRVQYVKNKDTSLCVCPSSSYCIRLLTCSVIPPSLRPGPDEVPEVRELGPAAGGQAGPWAAGEVAAHGCGGLPGAAVVPFHKPHSATLRRGAPSAGWWWGRRRRTWP